MVLVAVSRVRGTVLPQLSHGKVPVGRSASTTVAEHIGAQQRHSDPDDEEADPPRRRHRLAEDRDAEDELECRGDVLEHAHPRQGDAPCSRTEEDDRKSTRLNSSHVAISYAVFCLKKKERPPSTPTPSLPRCYAPSR